MSDAEPTHRYYGMVNYQGEQRRVRVVLVGVEGDPRPWRVDAPGEAVDGWLLADREVFRPQAPS